ncbi:MAG: DUF4474 domain-containing protein [Clostridiales bacterium]|nr:DUF4474 domain-containing protein [Clostridiales bacterium]
MSIKKIIALAISASIAICASCVTTAGIRSATLDNAAQPAAETSVVTESGVAGAKTNLTPGANYLASIAKTSYKSKKTATASKSTKKSSFNLKSLLNSIDVRELLTGRQVLGYKYSPDGYYYTDDKECWQANAGYNLTYDTLAGLGAMYIDSVRIRFTYGNKDWMVQLWKGQYGYLFVGAEIGLYTAPKGTYNANDKGSVNHYNCAGKEDWLNMQLDCYWAKNNDGHYVKQFTRPYDKYWWATGFVKGQLTKYSAPRTELKTRNRITFKSTEMANIFVKGLKKAGFRRSASVKGLVDDGYYQNGADVWVLWSSISQEAFAS